MSVPARTASTPGRQGGLIKEDARVLFRNFSGLEGKYNRAGDRNFCLVLNDDEAEAMERDGWNVKYLKAREDVEGDTPTPYVHVTASWKNRPPKLVLITSRGRVDLTEAEAELLDWVDIKQVDVIVNPYHWNVSGETGIKAYLKTIVVILQEDYLEQKYAEVEYAEGGTKALEGNTDHEPLELNRGSEEYDETHDIVEAELVGED